MNDRVRTAQNLCVAASEFIGRRMGFTSWLQGGDEALVLRADGPDAAYVVHASPEWRSNAELEWCHRVARHVAAAGVCAVVPFDRQGGTVFGAQNYLVSVFPYVEAVMLDREVAELRTEAAQLLAKIHRSLLSWRGGNRPASGNPTPEARALPQVLEDADLDAVWAAAQRQHLQLGVTHGDFYRGNVLCSHGKIRALIDWHEASIRPLSLELAGATFEFCRSDEHELSLERAESFIRSYRAAGGPVSDEEISMLPSLVRVWIRSDVRTAIAHGGNLNDDYIAKQVHAFRQVSDTLWDPLSD